MSNASRTRRHGTRASASISTASLLLRLAVGITFVWTGLGKVLGTMPVSGEQAATLAGMGAISTPAGAEPAPMPIVRPETPKEPETKPEPAKPKHRPVKPPSKPEPKPELKPEPKPAPKPVEPKPIEPKPVEPSTPQPDQPAKPDVPAAPPVPPKEPSPETPSTPLTTPVAPDEPKPTEPKKPEDTRGTHTSEAWSPLVFEDERLDPTLPRIVLVQSSASSSSPSPAKGPHIYTAADFPEPVRIARVWGLALVIKSAAEPQPDAAGSTPMPLWPKALSEGAWPKRLAYAVAITELGGGLCVLLGLITRLWAFGLAGVMLGAMWLTQIGPMAQSWNGFSGIFNGKAWDDPSAWSTVWLQVALLTASLAILLIGPGRVSLDAALFGTGVTDDDSDEL